MLVLAQGKVERDAAADFIVGFFIARIPILLFQAIQAALLPKLAALSGAGKHDDFRSGLKKLVMIVVGVGVLGVVAGATIGPTVGEILFGDKFNLGSRDLTLLFLGSAAFILALTLAQALIALLGHGRALIAWTVGLVFCVGVMALGSSATVDDLFLRVELGYLAGCATAATMMADLPAGAGCGAKAREPQPPRRGHRARAARDLISLAIHDPAGARRHTAARAPHGDRRGRRRPHHGARDAAPTSMSPRTPSPGAVVTTSQAAVPPGVARRHRAGSPRAFVRQAWLRVEHPRIERWTGPVDVVHATNYVAPPTRAPSIVSVYDLGFVRFPELCTADALQYPTLLRACHRPRRVDPHDERLRRAPRSPTDVRRARRSASCASTPGCRPSEGGDAGVRAARSPAPIATCSSSGTIEPRKNLPMLVRAFDAAADDDPELALVVAGAAGWGVDAFDDVAGAALTTEVGSARLGYVSDGAAPRPARGRRRARVPVALRGLRLPAARGDGGGRAGRRGARAARFPRSSATPHCSSTPTTSTPSPPPCSRCSPTIRISAGALVTRARRSSPRFSWARTSDELADALPDRLAGA